MLEARRDARCDREDRHDGGERELEAGVEDHVWVPREQRDRAQKQRLPRVAHAPAQPRERGKRTCDSGADHRRLRPDGNHIACDRGERTELADHAADAEKPGCEERAGGNEDDVLAADREDVVEPRGAKVAAQAVRERRVVAEDDAFEDRAPFSRHTGRNRAGERGSQPVGKPAEAAAAAEDAPRVDADDDVYAVTA